MLPPNEWHETGLLFSNYIIRAKGYETIYLGQDVPYENIALVIKLCKPSHVLSFFIARKTEEELKHMRKKLSVPKDTHLLVAGSAECVNVIRPEKNTTVLNSPSDLLNFL